MHESIFFLIVRMGPLFSHKYNLYLSGFAKTWLKKFQVHFYNNLTSKSNGNYYCSKVTS